MSSRRLARNYIWLAVGETAAKVFTFLSFTYLGRTLGPRTYGDLELSFSIFMLLMLFVQFGIGAYGARELARDPSRERALLVEIVETRLLAAAIAAIFLLSLAAVLPKPLAVRLLLASYTLGLFASSLLLLWLFQARDAMQWVAGATLIRCITFAFCVFFVVRSAERLYWIGIFETVSSLTAALFCWIIAANKLGLALPRVRFRPALAWSHLRAAAPIGWANVCLAAIWYLPLVVLGLRIGDESVGWFGAAHRMSMAIHTFAVWYFFNLLPAISRCAASPVAELRELIRGSLTVSIWAAVFVALGFSLAGRSVMTLAYGPVYAPGGELISVLIWAVPIAVVAGHYHNILLGYGLQRLLFVAMAAGAVSAGGAAYLLAPRLGAPAAAYSLLAASAVSLTLSYRFVSTRVTAISFLPALWRPALALAAAFLASREIPNPWLSTSLACSVYAALFALWQRRDLGRWRGALFGSPQRPSLS